MIGAWPGLDQRRLGCVDEIHGVQFALARHHRIDRRDAVSEREDPVAGFHPGECVIRQTCRTLPLSCVSEGGAHADGQRSLYILLMTTVGIYSRLSQNPD